jgi:hypothetical protein
MDKFFLGIISVALYGSGIYLVWGVDWSVIAGIALIVAGGLFAQAQNEG